MPPNVRILFTSWYTGLGGGETDLLTLAASLDPARYQPHLLLPAEGPLGDTWRTRGWPLHITHWRGASTWFVPFIWARFPVVQRMAALIEQEEIDLIHADYHTLPLIAPAAQQAQRPLIWTCHGWWFHPRPWQRAFFRQIDAGVARSEAIRDGFLGRPPFMPPASLPVIYSGIDTERFHPGIDGLRLRFQTSIPADAPLVAMVARFQPVKGHHTFQQMARQVALQIPEAHFVVAGEDTFGVASDAVYRDEMLAAAEADPLLRRRLHYIGFREDVERVYGAADVIVCASDFESYGKANLEAMACGKAVVSTNRGGPAETILDGETGLLVPPGDPAALAANVIRLLRDPAERERLGQAGRNRIESVFAADSAARAYETIFDGLISTNSA